MSGAVPEEETTGTRADTTRASSIPPVSGFRSWMTYINSCGANPPRLEGSQRLGQEPEYARRQLELLMTD